MTSRMWARYLAAGVTVQRDRATVWERLVGASYRL
jgi:hypothetical protein